ncbi:hypothetical protein CDL15_Pgr004299 [Punica granatum]|uniref:Uncharacterized protein n=1 Tax=Punica granatum TaxID=22663 RepID=A0A218XGE8_PUNGR|nr:hypothetical protein CDL15_Pgr004299 [Punica granatum]
MKTRKGIPCAEQGRGGVKHQDVRDNIKRDRMTGRGTGNGGKCTKRQQDRICICSTFKDERLVNVLTLVDLFTWEADHRRAVGRQRLEKLT